MISPLILAFGAIAFGFVWFAYLYNFLYVFNTDIDTYGKVFPRAIWQTMTGLYILEVCLAGIMGIKEAWPQFALMIVTIPVTALYQIFLQWKLRKALLYVNATALLPESAQVHDNATEAKKSSTSDPVTQPSSAEKIPDEATLGTPKGSHEIPHTEYQHPAVSAPTPIVWLPKDGLGISDEEVADMTEKGIKASNGGATMSDKVKLAWTEDPPDYEP
jgi:hypothetical protein